ncbi:hypothetical protein TruAng_001976 [Truncatella angustata]|nr:hypothetical protein TruAng_001976 [Truncatella angustata]
MGSHSSLADLSATAENSTAVPVNASTQTTTSHTSVQAISVDPTQTFDNNNDDGIATQTASANASVQNTPAQPAIGDNSHVSDDNSENNIPTPGSATTAPLRTHSAEVSDATAHPNNITHDSSDSSRPAQLLARFMAMNSALFPQAVDDSDETHDDDEVIVTLRIDGFDIIIHREITEKSKMLRTRLNPNWDPDCIAVVILDGDYKIWLIVVLAMYGCVALPFGIIEDKPACAIIEALVHSDYLLVTYDVQVCLCRMITARFAAFKDWKIIPYNSLTQQFHTNRAIEINETHKTWSALDNGIYTPFLEVGFALLLSHYCPLPVYHQVRHHFSHALDGLGHTVGMHLANGDRLLIDSAFCLFTFPPPGVL